MAFGGGRHRRLRLRRRHRLRRGGRRLPPLQRATSRRCGAAAQRWSARRPRVRCATSNHSSCHQHLRPRRVRLLQRGPPRRLHVFDVLRGGAAARGHRRRVRPRVVPRRLPSFRANRSRRGASPRLRRRGAVDASVAAAVAASAFSSAADARGARRPLPSSANALESVSSSRARLAAAALLVASYPPPPFASAAAAAAFSAAAAAPSFTCSAATSSFGAATSAFTAATSAPPPPPSACSSPHALSKEVRSRSPRSKQPRAAPERLFDFSAAAAASVGAATCAPGAGGAEADVR